MKIKHKFFGTQLKYGYIWWHPEKDEEFKKFLPNIKKFDINIAGNIIKDRRADFNYHRIYVGKNIGNFFKENQVVFLEKKQDGKTIEIKKQ